ncbi:MAG: magnetochrome domain-containing protein [Magnetococcales bacterium]|nr:magnetochrome domain-containing protein [Magnetococcales bacterium]
MAISIAFSLVLFFLSVFAEDPWEDHVYNKAPPIAAGMSAPHLDGRERMTCSSCHEIIASHPNSGLSSTPPLVDGTPAVASHQDGRDQMPCANCHRILPNDAPSTPPAPGSLSPPAMTAPGNPATPLPAPGSLSSPAMTAPVGTPPTAMTAPGGTPPTAIMPDVVQTMMPTAMPTVTRETPASRNVAMASTPPRTPAAATLDPEWHERFMPTRFQGKIVRIVENSVQSGRVNTHILVHDGINAATWINLAPDWYLNAQGCRIGMGLFVKGTAYKETGSKQTALRYAKSFSVNGQSCSLRDKHLRGAWTGNGLKDQDEE